MPRCVVCRKEYDPWIKERHVCDRRFDNRRERDKPERNPSFAEMLEDGFAMIRLNDG